MVAVRCQLSLQSSEGSNGLDVQDGTCIGHSLMPAVGWELSWDQRLELSHAASPEWQSQDGQTSTMVAGFF